MDWNNVTGEELIDALREVDLKGPRPVWEFFSKFTPPKNQSKWLSRVKCNAYYYRTNYLILFVLCFLAPFLRNPMAILAITVNVLGILCLNDPFCNNVNDYLLRIMRRIHPSTAHKLRAKTGTQANLASARRGKHIIRILGIQRRVLVGCIALLGIYLLYISAAILTLAWAILIGLGLPLLHATLRSPNLKARLASAREEFRAVWRGYQADAPDYTN